MLTGRLKGSYWNYFGVNKWFPRVPCELKLVPGGRGVLVKKWLQPVKLKNCKWQRWWVFKIDCRVIFCLKKRTLAKIFIMEHAQPIKVCLNWINFSSLDSVYTGLSSGTDFTHVIKRARHSPKDNAGKKSLVESTILTGMTKLMAIYQWCGMSFSSNQTLFKIVFKGMQV